MKEVFCLVAMSVLIVTGIFKASENLVKNDLLFQDYVEVLLSEEESKIKEVFLNCLEDDLLDAKFNVSAVEASLEQLKDVTISSVETFVIDADFLTKSKAYDVIILTSLDGLKIEIYMKIKQVNGEAKVASISSRYEIK